MTTDSIPILSFFTGGGFLDIGFAKSGFKTVWYNEVDESFRKIYQTGTAGMMNSGIIRQHTAYCEARSVSLLSPTEILKAAFHGEVPTLFGVIGGPPCQDFSLNGSLRGFGGERGILTETYLYLIKKLKPAFFVMENVPGLIKRKSTKDYFYKLLTTLTKDYYIDLATLNALDFGVPQNRERVFVIGLRKTNFNVPDTPFHGWFPFRKYTIFKDPLNSFAWPAADGSEPKSTLPPPPAELCAGSKIFYSNAAVDKINGAECFNLHVSMDKIAAIQEGETNRPSYKRLHRKKFSPTVCYGNNEVHLHPFQPRRLTAREALRLQGVDDKYLLPVDVNLTKKFKLISNGVPVPMAAGVAKALRDFIKKHLKKN